MTNFQANLTALNIELQNILQAKARNLSFGISTLLLRTSYGSSLVLTDIMNQEYYVDEAYLSSFRDVYTNRAYKFLRLDQWEVQIHFQNKYCREIDIICTAATFLANKIETRHITGCYIKFTVILNPRDISKLSQKSLGYLRRISKRNFCQQSVNITRQMKSLIGFIPLQRKIPFGFDYKPWKQQQQIVQPLQALSASGLQAIKKLRHFISRQDIHDFVINHQVSKEASQELQKLITSRKIKKQESG